ncbi:MAG: PAS domain-containing protein [Alphaproteobacteria bacterium]|nr:PAS domain-containing protein [Alphaproteobacteria bacterium]
MSFTEFEATIRSSALKQVAQCWNEARGSRSMPGWKEMRPPRLGSRLSIVWSYTYDRSADTLTGRLAGDQIEAIFGKTFRGTPMAELYPPDQFREQFVRFKRVVSEGALYHLEGHVFKFVHRHGYGERIVMPLAEDGVLGDGVFGATAYDSVQALPAEELRDIEHWFSL